jgi:branched-subunit amino acid ABC-type transport system permease component
MYLGGTVAHALYDCRYGSQGCHESKLAYAAAMPIYAFMWIVFGRMAIRWITDEAPIKPIVGAAWIVSVFAYPLIESTVASGRFLRELVVFLAFDLAPVAPALFLGFYLAYRSFDYQERVDGNAKDEWG